MIHEGVVSTCNADGGAHLTPLGFRRDGERVELAPFLPSVTHDNLLRTGRAVMCLTDDVRVIAGCLTGRRDWPVVALAAGGWRLRDCLSHLELEVVAHMADAQRPRFACRVRASGTHGAFAGFNRAQAAVVEGAILVSRLDFIAPEKLAREFAYLTIAIDKTAGPREREAWQWLLDAVADHPRHRLTMETNP